MRIRERIAFISQTSSNFGQTGALQPSSRFLARAMTAPLRRARSRSEAPFRILEIGPGTGAVTRAIASCMAAGDELECYEINEGFVRYLEDSLADDPQMAPVADRITIHHAAAQDLATDRPYDFALCSAPLNNFDAATITAILEPTFAAIQGGGSLTLFEYVALPGMRRALVRGDEKRRLDAAAAVKDEWVRRHGRGTTPVVRNLPPARVHHLVAPDR